jgi:hypothetical protein
MPHRLVRAATGSFGAAVEDTWANPAGAFDMLKSADKVYRLLGADGLSAQTHARDE